MMGRAVVGFQFGNWIRPKTYLETQNPVPVDIPRLRYEIATRRVGNSAPVADAGPDQIGVTAGPVVLDGSNSRDPDGDPLTYQWEQIGGPGVSISGMNSARATFNAADGQTYIFRLTVRDPSGLSDSARTMVTATVAEVPRILRFQANPNVIDAGQPSTLTWQVEDAETVEISGIGRVATSGSSVVSPMQTTVYRLTARNRTGEVNETAVVTVRSQVPRFIRCQAIPATITPGEASTLSWEAENAETVSISPGVGSVSISGATPVSPTQTTTYVFTARGRSGEVNCTATVTVQTGSVRVVQFNVSPAQIAQGGSAQLCYTVENATEISISPAVPGFDPTRNSACLTVSPTATTTYVLTARNAAGTTTAAATITVGGVRITSFTNSPDYSTKAGDPVLLSWTTEGATSVTITGLGAPTGSLPASGNITVNPVTNTTYTLIAYGPNGSVSAVLYVFVR
jgi:hypothetical protein